MLDDSVLDELEAVAREATIRGHAGPWHFAHVRRNSRTVIVDNWPRNPYHRVATMGQGAEAEANGHFIAAASPERVGVLVREIEALREVEEAARRHQMRGLAAALDRVAALREEEK